MTNADELHWLIDQFVTETPGVIHAQAVSADGMDLAHSAGLDATQSDQLAAIASGLASLTDGAADILQITPVKRQVIETAAGWVLLSRISTLATMLVVTRSDADLGLVGFEMTRLTTKTGDVLSPELIERLKNSLAP